LRHASEQTDKHICDIRVCLFVCLSVCSLEYLKLYMLPVAAARSSPGDNEMRYAFPVS